MKIPFDVEIAKLALAAETGKIVTRNGYPAEITCWDGSNNIWPIMGKVDGVLCNEILWTEEGKWFNSEIDTELDLFIETDFDL